jgi:hypothetical protein
MLQAQVPSANITIDLAFLAILTSSQLIVFVIEFMF